MVVGGDGVHHHCIDAIAFAEFRAEPGVCAFLIVIHGFADVVQEAAHFGKLYICANFGSKNARELGNFYGMGELVLTI